MDDKKLDEIMHKYLSTTVKGQESDFKKMDVSNFTKKSHNMKAKAYICIAIVLVAVIAVVSIVLPKVLKDGGDNMFYANDNDIYFENVENKELLFSNFNNAIIPTFECESCLFHNICLKETGDIFGLSVSYGVYDEIFDDIDVYVLKDGYILFILEEYLTLENQLEWTGIKIKYEIIENDMQFKCKIYFKDGAYSYFISAIYYEPVDIQFILDNIYG